MEFILMAVMNKEKPDTDNKINIYKYKCYRAANMSWVEIIYKATIERQFL